MKTKFIFPVLIIILSGCTTQTSGPEPQTGFAVLEGEGSGLIAHYKFNETSGTLTPDTSKNGNNGTISGGAAYQPGKSGNDLSFDGLNDRVNITNDIIDTGTATVCAWIKTSALNSQRAIISNARFSFEIALSGNRLHLTSTQNNGLFSTANSIAMGTWYYVCVIRNSGTNGSGSIYINGTLNATGNTNTPASGFGLAIGDHQGNDRPWSGEIDEVRIYNRALSDSEIVSLYALENASVNPDTQAPTKPTALSSVAPYSSSRINLSWQASVDNTAVTGYKIFRGGAEIARTSATNYSDSGLTQNTAYTYTILAYDAAGNFSVQSDALSATTQQTPTTYLLSVTKSGTGNGTISGAGIDCGTDCSENTAIGSTVTLNATATSDSVFSGWIGSCSGTGSCIINMNSNNNITASFNSENSVPANYSCGNNITEPGEACDGTSMGFATSSCSSLHGFKSGQLLCKNDCSGYDISQCISGNTYVSASCSQTDISATIAKAISGDTVMVPAGTCTWTSQLTIDNSKRLRIIGAGLATTTLRRDTPGIIFYLGTSGSRISGFTFLLGHHDTVGVAADGSGWRVDNSRFSSKGNYPTGIWALPETKGKHTYGLIDHDKFDDSMIIVASGNLMENNLWADELNLGTYQAVYVEDNNIVFKAFGDAINSNYGGKYVMRNNSITDTMIETHSVQGTNRASRSWEIYNNTINQLTFAQSTPFFIRGGTGVIFNNTITGVWTNPGVTFDNVRSVDARFGENSEPGQCWGGSPWDGNDPLESQGSGAHSGNSSVTTLQDGTKNWAVNSLVGNWIWNLNDGSKGKIISNTANTVTATLAGGTKNIWSSADVYKISNGYPCRDQIGRSKDMWLWTNSTPYPPQQLDPAYIWNNKQNGKLVGASGNPANQIKQGKDYFVGVPRPGYIPYVYPHPLAQIDSNVSVAQIPICGAVLNTCLKGTLFDTNDSTTHSLWSCSIDTSTVICSHLKTAELKDSDNDGIDDAFDRCTKTKPSARTFVNQHGCAKPIATKFDIKPDFNSTDVNGMQNFEIGITQIGKISYTNQNITLTKIVTSQTGNEDDQLNIDADLNITTGKIEINTNQLPMLNKPATITLYNITATNPQIKKDGIICTQCTIISHDKQSGTLVFTVPGF